MKKYTHQIFGGEMKEVRTTETHKVELLESNVMELQGQLAEANKRIMELLETVKQQQAQLSYYKSESI